MRDGSGTFWVLFGSIPFLSPIYSGVSIVLLISCLLRFVRLQAVKFLKEDLEISSSKAASSLISASTMSSPAE